MNTVAVLILAYNKLEHTRHCLKGMLASTYRHLHFHLVDNGSTEAVSGAFESFAKDAAKKGWTCEIQRLDAPAGAIVGRNAGFERLMPRTGLRAIALCDNDVMPRHASWVERLCAALESNPAIGIVGPKLVYPLLPHLIQCAGADVSPDGRVDFSGRGAARDTAAFARDREVQALISACWLMRPEFPRTIGLLDEQFSPVQYEDIDYCYRVREAGFQCRYVAGVEMYHFENTTTDGSPTVNFPYVTVKNGMKFKAKWARRFQTENGKPSREMVWKEIAKVRLEQVPEPEILP